MPTITLVSRALSTLYRTKVFLGISGDRHDGLLTLLLNQATGIIEQYCGRTFKETTYTSELYDGNNRETLLLRQHPVTAVTALEESEDYADSSPTWETIASSRYQVLSDGRIEALDFMFAAGKRNWRVTYTAGYKINFDAEDTAGSHTLPPDLESACVRLVAKAFNRRRVEGFQSTTQGDLAATLGPGMLDDDIKSVLDQYRTPSV